MVQGKSASIIPLPTTSAVAVQLREPAPIHNLPVQLTQLIGREQESLSMAELIDPCGCLETLLCRFTKTPSLLLFGKALELSDLVSLSRHQHIVFLSSLPR